MVWLATDKDGDECIYASRPSRDKNTWYTPASYEDDSGYFMYIPKGSIKKLIGKDLTFDDEPVELE